MQRGPETAEVLLQAGMDLAGAGGPEAVLLREAGRLAGVASSTAHWHYATAVAFKLDVRARAEGFFMTVAEDELLQEFGPDAQAREWSALLPRLEVLAMALVEAAHDAPGLFLMAQWAPVLDSRADATAGQAWPPLLRNVLVRELEHLAPTTVQQEVITSLFATSAQGLAWAAATRSCGYDDLARRENHARRLARLYHREASPEAATGSER